MRFPLPIPHVFSAFLLLGSLLACVPAAGPSSPAATSGAIAIVGATVLPMDSERALPGQTVLLRDDRIIEVGLSADVVVPPGTRVIDGTGKYLVPGLVDMHVHIAREEDLGLYLARGVTTVRNMWGAPLHLSWRARIRSGELAGPDIVTAGPILDGDPPVHDGSLILRTEEDAERAVAMHRERGYDFVKFYSRLSPQVYERLVAAAKTAGLPTAGHVPHAAGLARALESRPGSIEHLTGFVDALQSDSSPVKGKMDRQSRQKWIDHVDESRLAPLARRFHDLGIWSCPTMGVIDDLTEAEGRARLAAPEMKYVPPFVLATWEPRKDPPPEILDGWRRSSALNRKLVRALHDAGAHLLAGTDTGNPLAVPGFSLHDELARLVAAGLTPYEALRAATADAAEYLHRDREQGTIAPGRRADLVLLDANPLTDIHNTSRISAVVARGRLLGTDDLTALLTRSEKAYREGGNPMGNTPAPESFEALSERTGPTAAPGGAQSKESPATVELDATYEITWKGVRFGGERIRVERTPDNRLRLLSQAVDPYKGQLTTVHLWFGEAGAGQRMIVDSDGATGRGHAEITRESGRATMAGILLSGAPFTQQEDLPEGALFGADQLLAGQFVVASRLENVALGQTVELHVREFALGSTATLPDALWKITRGPDIDIPLGLMTARLRRFDITRDEGPPMTLWLDPRGFPVSWEIQSYGATVRYVRFLP